MGLQEIKRRVQTRWSLTLGEETVRNAPDQATPETPTVWLPETSQASQRAGPGLRSATTCPSTHKGCPRAERSGSTAASATADGGFPCGWRTALVGMRSKKDSWLCRQKQEEQAQSASHHAHEVLRLDEDSMRALSEPPPLARSSGLGRGRTPDLQVLRIDGLPPQAIRLYNCRTGSPSRINRPTPSNC